MFSKSDINWYIWQWNIIIMYNHLKNENKFMLSPKINMLYPTIDSLVSVDKVLS